MANTISRMTGNGDRSVTETQWRESREAPTGRRGAAEGIPRSANSNRSAAEGIPRSASVATWDATRDAAFVGASRTSQQSKDASLNTASPQSEGGDEVQITNMAAKLATLGQSLSGSSPVDGARVARISQALADGSYRISAQQIASGLMQSDRALEQIGL